MSESLLFASSLANAIAFSSWNLYKLWKRRINKNETFCIITARHSGITTAVQKLREDNQEFNRAIIVDENDVIERQSERRVEHLMTLRDSNVDAYTVEIFPLIRDYLTQLREIHGNRPIILFSSLLALPKFLEIKPKRCLLLYTSSDFHAELIEGHSRDGKSQQTIKRMSDSRDLLLSQPYERLKYRGFGELARMLENLLFGRWRK